MELAAAVLAGLVLLSGVAVWRLASDEPIRLSFLTSYLERALSAPDGSFTLRIDRTQLTWAGWERSFDLRAKGVRAIGADGEVIAVVPEIAVSLSVRALLRGVVAPTAIDIFHPRLYLTRDGDGRFRFGRTDEPEPEEGASSILSRLLGDLVRPPDRDRPTGYLRAASIIDGRLVYVDRRLGFTRRAPDADIVLRRTRGGLAGELSLAVEQRGAPARLSAQLSYRRAADRITVSAQFHDVAAAELAELAPALAPLSGADLRVEGRMATILGLDGTIGATGLDLTVGPGSLVLPALSQAPLAVRQGSLRAHLDADGDRLMVEQAVLQLEGPRLTATGTVSGLTSYSRPRFGRIRVAGRVTAADVPTAMVERYWPAGLARGARKWVSENIEDGTVEHAEAEVAIRLPGGDPDRAVVQSLTGAFSAAGLTVHYIKPMPPLRDVDGIASFTDREFVADLHGGGVEGLSIESGQIRIGDFREKGPETVEITGRARGALPDALRLLDHPRLGYPSKLGLKAAETAGAVSARLSFRFPAVKHLTFDQVEIGVSADVAGAALRDAMFGQDVSQGDLSIEVTNTEMTVAGKALFGGVPAKMHWVEKFSGEGFRSRIALSGSFDAEQRAAFGLDLRPYLEGPVAADLLLTRFAGGRTLLAASFDLAPATLSLPFLEWSKTPGEPGKASFVLELEGERPVAISGLSVTSGSLSAAGRGRFDAAGGRLEAVDLDSLAFGNSALSGVEIAFSPARIDVTVAGGRLDAEPFFAGGEGGAAMPKEEPSAFTLHADRLDEVRLGPDRAVTGVTVDLDHGERFWQHIRVEGTLPGGHPMSLRYEPAEPGKHRLVVNAEDAGAALRVLGILDDVVGGQLRIAALAEDDEPERPLHGKAEISEFRLADAPVLARILTIATLTGLVDVLTGEGFLFVRFVGEFTKTGDRLEIPLARAYGPSLGLTATGTIDLGADTVDLKGTIVPAYAINNILGNIPIIGDILQGGKGEGIFAATYHASGPLGDPQVTVNPLAALAPGFLRGLFEILEGGSGKPPRPTALPEPGTNK